MPPVRVEIDSVPRVEAADQPVGQVVRARESDLLRHLLHRVVLEEVELVARRCVGVDVEETIEVDVPRDRRPRGERRLDYRDPVATLWPEFALAGKEKATIAHVLSHQVGLPGFREPTTTNDLYDWERCCGALARQAPCWKPGSDTSYHAMTFGYLAGEILRRASGETVGRLVERRIARPLGADLFIGLPLAEEKRVAEMIGPMRSPDMSALVIPEAAMMALVNPQLDPEVPNTRAWRTAEIPAANGHVSAQGIARLYAALANGGSLEGMRLCSATAIDRMTEVQSPRRDQLLGFEGNWALGVSFNAMGLLGPDPRTFGHMGWGGSFGCANRERNVAIGYVCNQMGAELVGDPRARALCETIFACL